MTRLRIGFLLPHYSERSQSQMPEVLRLLRDAGVDVDVVNPAGRMVDLSEVRVEHDLYVLKKMGGLGLSLAGALHARGAAIVNPYPASMVLYDKIITFRILEAAGVPTPASYAASHAEELSPLLDAGPLIVKPYHGSSGYGVRVVRTAAELADVPREKGPVFAQRYHPPEGRDRKLYAIGDRIFGTFKVFPARTEAEKHGEPFTPGPELCEIVRQCGRALGIDLYGVDIIESAGRLYVVDMSTMPGFKGVPEASRLLAEYFRAAAERAARGELEAGAAPSPARHPDDDPEALRRLVARGSALDLVLHALSTTPATTAQLERVRRLLEELADPGGRALR
jgi:ribosomal protein S6--L-glutamate ligase